MSAVSSVAGSPASQLLQQMQQRLQRAGDPSATFDQLPAEVQTRVQAKAEAAGLAVSKASALRHDLQAALLQIEPGADPRDALGAVFEKHGIDPSQLKDKMQGMMGKLGSPFQGLQGGLGANSASTPTDLLNNLLESLDSDENEEPDGNELLSFLKNINGLPAGIIVDQTA